MLWRNGEVLKGLYGYMWKDLSEDDGRSESEDYDESLRDSEAGESGSSGDEVIWVYFVYLRQCNDAGN